MQPRAPSKPASIHAPSRWRPGIGVQLSVSLLAVAVLAVAAFFAAQRTILVTVTHTAPATVVEAAPALPVPPLPTAPVPLTVTVDGSAALPALDELARLVGQASMAAGPEELRRAQESARELASRSARVYGSGVVRTARAAEPAMAVLELSAKRQAAFGDYNATLDRADARFQAAVDGAWKILGRVVARQSLLTLDRQFDEFRRDADQLRNDSRSPAAAEQWRAAAKKLSTALAVNALAVQRSQGEAWYADTVRDLVRINTLGEELLQMDAQRSGSVAAFQAEAQKLRSRLRQPVVAAPVTAERVAHAPLSAASPPAPLTTTTAAPVPVTEVVSRQEQRQGFTVTGFAVLAGAVLLVLLAFGAFTVSSIVSPVRRLVAATHRISRGEPHVRVERGGSKELDGLAASFNDMAAQLEEAQALARGAHERLEARVIERTGQLQHQAEHDALTHLPNRRQLFDRLREATARADQAGGCIDVFFLDLDNFKTINDGLGHTLGDRVLVAIAARLQQLVGPQGLAARFGGDEFVVMIETQREAGALLDWGQQLVSAFEAPLQLGDTELLVSVSVGAAAYPAHADDAESLLRAADAAMFRAKAQGRNQLYIFTNELLHAAAARFSTEQGLRLAIERGELELVFQPEVNLATMEVDLVETLLRWRLPDGRLASPGEFLEVAEESGLMRDINAWVLRTAIAAAARWRRDGLPNLHISINVTARDLGDAELPERIGTLLREHGLPPEALEIELTETVLQTGAATLDAVRLLRQQGIAIALDDFGTGYSTLASLEQLPLTRVKLDRSLIAGVDSSPRSMAIANAIIALCRDLGLQITAEGVERPAQLAFLREFPLHLQGYLLSRPVPETLLGETLALLPGRLQAALLTAGTSGAPLSAANASLQEPAATRRQA